MKIRILFIFIVIIAGSFLSFGCEADSGNNETAGDKILDDNGNVEIGPEAVVQTFMISIEELDLDKAKNLVSKDYVAEFEIYYRELSNAIESDTTEAATIRETFKALFKSSEVAVIDYEIDEAEAVVRTSNTHPDPEQFDELWTNKIHDTITNNQLSVEEMTDDEIMQISLSIFKETLDEVKYITTENEVPLVKENGQWRIDGIVTAGYIIGN